MRVVVQRVNNSSVEVEGKTVGKINKGLTLLVGFTYEDSIKDIEYITKKILNLRIFDDDKGIMNRSIMDVKGEILSISQFTLYADTKKGNRPSYINALKSEKAIILYNEFNKELSKNIKVETGIFGSEMKVNIENDGPITIILDSKDVKK